jgi:hypothetical protein
MESTLGDLGRSKSTEKTFDLDGFGGRIKRGREQPPLLFGGEGGSEGGGQLRAGRANLNLKCGATQHGAAQATAASLSMAPH